MWPFKPKISDSIGVDFKLKIKGKATLCDIQMTEKLENDKT